MTSESPQPKQTFLVTLPYPYLSYALLLAVAFVICAALGMAINPQTGTKIFFPPAEIPNLASKSQSYYWDIAAYAAMAVKFSCNAFYPFWAWLIRAGWHPQTEMAAVKGFQFTAMGLFFSSLPLLVYVFEQSLKDRLLTFCVALAYVLSPMAIFRVIGYTEGLFGVLSLVFLGALSGRVGKWPGLQMGILCATTAIMSLTRPILVQFVGASVAALVTLVGFAWIQYGIGNRGFMGHAYRKYRHLGITTLLTSLSAFLGYAIYGFYCLQSRGNFWAPFQDQSLWKKSLGWRPELLLLPRSPLIDLLALYLPLLVLGVGLMIALSNLKQRSVGFLPRSPGWLVLGIYPPLLILVYGIVAWHKRPSPIPLSAAGLALGENYLFWFCGYFAAAHSAIAFFTQDRLVSLGRYNFALPFIFLAIGVLCTCFPGRKRYLLLLGLAGVSALLLMQQWVDYGFHKWLG